MPLISFHLSGIIDLQVPDESFEFAEDSLKANVRLENSKDSNVDVQCVGLCQLPGRCDHNISELNYTFLGALKVDWASRALVTIKGTAGDSRNFTMIDHDDSVLRDGNNSSDQGNIEGLPNIGPARLLRSRRKESIDSSGVAIAWLEP